MQHITVCMSPNTQPSPPPPPPTTVNHHQPPQPTQTKGNYHNINNDGDNDNDNDNDDDNDDDNEWPQTNNAAEVAVDGVAWPPPHSRAAMSCTWFMSQNIKVLFTHLNVHRDRQWYAKINNYPRMLT